MYIVYIDDSIATTTNNPVEANCYKDQLERSGRENVRVESN